MKEKKRTSVIITCHNYGKFLEECVESVLAQKLSAKEIFVINDSSKDNTEDVAKKFGDKIKYYHVYFKNAQKTRNFALKKVTGEFVLYLDADDYLREDCIEKMEQVMAENSDMALVYSDRINFGNEKLIKQLNMEGEWKSRDYDYKYLIKENYISITSLIRRRLFQGFDENIKRFQDWEAWLTLLKGKKAKRIPEALFFVRFHGENKTLKNDGVNERVKVLVKHNLVDVLVDDFKYLEAKNKVNEEEINKKEDAINNIINSKSFRVGNLFFRSIRSPWKMFTFPMNFLVILLFSKKKGRIRK